MPVNGLRITEQPVQQNLGGRTRGEIPPADNAVHAAFMIIHHAGEVIRKCAVASPHHRIPHRMRRPLRQIKTRFVYHMDMLIRKFNPDRIRALSPTSRGKRMRAAPVVVGVSAVRRRTAVFTEPSARTRARVKTTQRLETVHHRFVVHAAIGLNNHPVPRQSKPAQVIDHPLNKTGTAAIRIKVLQSKPDFRPPRSGIQPAQQRRQHRAGVRGAGGGRSESCAHDHGQIPNAPGARAHLAIKNRVALTGNP